MRPASTGCPSARHRGGYALLAVLWICVGVGALGTMISVAGRSVTTASRNRIALTRAEWWAEGCLSRARAFLTTALREEARRPERSTAPVWVRADRALRPEGRSGFSRCEISIVPVGSHLDVNAADESTLIRLLQQIGLKSPGADSLAAAIADWMDPDTLPRPFGAEQGWYASRNRVRPPDRPFTTPRELRHVRGVEDRLRLAAFLDTEGQSVSVNHAPPEVLAALPGFGPEAVDRVLDRRERSPLASFDDLKTGLSSPARAAIDQARVRLSPLITFEPAGWVLTIRSTAGSPPVTAVLEAWIEKIGAEVSVWRRRRWIE